MAIERELKYVVKEGFEPFSERKQEMIQGYLCTHHQGLNLTLRVRITEDKAYLTIKGIPLEEDPSSRNEYEYEIPVSDAREMLKMSLYPPVHKIRYFIPWGEYLFEVDRFLDENEGLITAEVELEPGQNPPTNLPEWICSEVTGKGRYYNSALSRFPFKQWSSERRNHYTTIQEQHNTIKKK
ncbi:MAG: CYTH domain-containing protein [Porphyromonas sp.]|nr:CYTH domain-containing protein [Porphyromonas sp.]